MDSFWTQDDFFFFLAYSVNLNWLSVADKVNRSWAVRQETITSRMKWSHIQGNNENFVSVGIRKEE